MRLAKGPEKQLALVSLNARVLLLTDSPLTWAYHSPLPNNPFALLMTAPTPVVTDQSQLDLAEKNRQLAERFFVILETYDFEGLLEIFAPDSVKLMPYAPAGVGDTVNGAQAIYEQFSDMPRLFTSAKFPRRIYTTEDPNLLFVTCTGDLDLKDGSKYENDYVFIFKLTGGKITELSEFYNPILMAKAFGVPL